MSLSNTLRKNRNNQRDFKFEQWWKENREDILVALSINDTIIQDTIVEAIKELYKKCYFDSWKESGKQRFSLPHEYEKPELIKKDNGAVVSASKYEV